MKTFFRTKARSATSLSPGGRALAMRGFAWPQSTSKRKDNIRKRFSTIRIAKQPRCIAHWGVCSGADGRSAHNTQKASAIKPETSSPVTHTCLASRSPACPPPSAWRLAGPHRVTPIIAIPDWTRRAKRCICTATATRKACAPALQTLEKPAHRPYWSDHLRGSSAGALLGAGAGFAARAAPPCSSAKQRT